MSQDHHEKSGDHGRRRDRFEFYYYERVGDRYYLRITRFSLYLMIGLAAVMMPFLLLMDSRSRIDNVNVQIGPRDTSRDRPPPTFEPIPLRDFGTSSGKGTGAATPSRRRPSPTPTPTPSATPAETPGPNLVRPPTSPGTPG